MMLKRMLKSLLQFSGYTIKKNDVLKRVDLQTFSYSQYGEDSIIAFLLDFYKLKAVNYMDIGANHPFKLNNSAVLYLYGMTGINIEPDGNMFKELQKERQRDINLNIGIHKNEGILKYYELNDSVYNTFSLEEANKIVSKGYKIVNIKDVEVKTYNSIVSQYLKGIPPTILFLDVEGIDEEIINSIDFKNYKPTILCIETYAFGIGVKNYHLIEKIKNHGYSVFADTFVNTIFMSNS